MPRPPSSRPHDAEAGREPPSHASGLAPSALIHALDDLQPDPLNANRGTDRGREALRRSLRTYGAGRSIVIDKRGRILGGHKTVVMQPPEPVATDQAGRRRAHAASWLPRLRHRRGQAPGPHACGASTGRLIADALCPPDPRRSGTVSHDRTAMRCRAADLGWPVSQWCHQETLKPHGWLTEDEVTRKRRELSRTMWETTYELPEPRTEGRAIDPAAVERMFDATRGAHVSPGELEHLWRGQPGPPAVHRHRLGPKARLHRRRCRALRDHAAPARRRLPHPATALADHDRAGRLPPRCISGAGGT